MKFQPHDVVWTPEKVARFWDFLAANDAHDADRFSFHSGATIAKWADRSINLTGKAILDYGCGTGFLLEHLANQGKCRELWGLDFSEGSVEATRQRCEQFGAFEGATLAQEVPTPFQAERFDVIFLIEVVEHLRDEELESSLSEVRRLLRPGGYVVITTPNDENLERRRRMCPDCGARFHPKQHVRSWSADTLQKKLRSFGFAPCRVEATNWGVLARPKPIAAAQLAAYRALGRASSIEVHLAYIGQK